MFRHLYTYFLKSKLSRWRIFMILSSSLLLVLFYNSNKRITFSVDSSKLKKKRKMVEKASDLFKNIEDHERSSNVSILIANKEKCQEKIIQMINDGTDFLQVISDFDRTMSSYMSNCRLNLTCHGVFEADPEFSEDCKNLMASLRNKYYPIEIDTRKSDSEKIPYMIEWWSKAHELLVSSRLRRDILESTVRNYEIELRASCDEFMQLLNGKNIPMLIFSAGIGNVIESMLKYKGLLFNNVRIVSNFMNFNNEGILTGFQNEIIHTFNKSAKSIQDSEFYENICVKRKNIILIGDSSGDPHMSDGLPDDVNVLKIGFLNYDVENLKEKYMALYDIVAVTDETFVVPKLILNTISSF